MVWAFVCKVLPKFARALPSLSAKTRAQVGRRQQNVMLDAKQTRLQLGDIPWRFTSNHIPTQD